MGGLSVSGTGATTRIALGVTNSWGNWDGQPVVQLSDDGGTTWREIAAMMPHTHPDGLLRLDRRRRDRPERPRPHPARVRRRCVGNAQRLVGHAAPGPAVNGIEETATMALVTPPPGANVLADEQRLERRRHARADRTGSRRPRAAAGGFDSTVQRGLAWSTPAFIATLGSPDWQPPNRWAPTRPTPA